MPIVIRWFFQFQIMTQLTRERTPDSRAFARLKRESMKANDGLTPRQCPHEPTAKAGASSAHSKRCRGMLKVTELREAFGVRPACWRFWFLVPMRVADHVAVSPDLKGARTLVRFDRRRPRSSRKKKSPPKVRAPKRTEVRAPLAAACTA